MTIPPVHRTVTVPWTPEAAFERFTAGIAGWWPTRTNSIGGGRLASVTFESGIGGRIFERHHDGRRFLWGTVLEWDPPRKVRFTWHPGRDPDHPTEVSLTFSPTAGGTRLDLVHTGWERLGAKGAREAKGYGIGWRYVLDVWAGRRGAFVRVLDLVAAVLTLAQRIKRRGRDPRDEAGGELTTG